MRYEDASGTFQASGPIANDDSDTLTAGSRGPATGNVITGEGTQYGSAGADSAAGAQVTALAGKGGEDTSFAGGKLSVAGEFGHLSVDAQGNYTYLANTGAPENVRDRFTYTLADNQGNSDTAALIVEIGKTPVVIKADAQQIVPGPDGVVTLPPGVELSDIMVVGRNLVVNMPDGTQLIIIDGAVFVPQLVLGGVEVPATNVAALLIGQEVQPAAGETPPSGGGNFALPPPPLDPGVPLGDLIPPTEYNYIPPEPQEVLDTLDEEPEAGAAAVALDDDVIPDKGGNAGGTGDEAPDTVGQNVASGFLPGSGGDGDLEWSLLETGAPAGFTYDLQPDGSIDVIQVQDGNPVVVLTIEVNADTGAFEVTQNNPIRHAAGDNENNSEFVINYNVTDEDGDVAPGTLTINVDDDTPTASVTAGSDTNVILTTDDAQTIGINSDTAVTLADFSGVFTGTTTSAGADGAGAGTTGGYALAVTSQTSGLMSHGVAINLYMVGNTVVGATGSQPADLNDGDIVFTVAVDGNGVVTLTQMQQIDHAPETPSGSPFNDQFANMSDGLVTLTRSVTVVDNDGDSVTASATVSIGQNLHFTDDGPTVDGARAGSSVTLDETDGAEPVSSGAPIVVTSDDPMIVPLGVNYGADGQGPNPVYGLSLMGGVTSLASGLQTAAGDHPITLVLIDSDTIQGQYTSGGTQVAFIIEMNDDGTVTVTQNTALEHHVDGPPGPAHDDSLTLTTVINEQTVSLVNATVTVEDFDGDTATASAPIGGAITFKDDGPSIDITVGSDANILLVTDDDGTEGDGETSDSTDADFSGAFSLGSSNGGGDGTASTSLISYSLSTLGGASGLTSNGDPINLYLVDGVVVGAIGSEPADLNDADIVFTVEVDGDGIVTLTQLQQIDHPAVDDPDGTDAPFIDDTISLVDNLITLHAEATITDNDGDTDSDTASLDIGANLVFRDDGPTIDASLVEGASVHVDESDPGTDGPGETDDPGLGQVTVALTDIVDFVENPESADQPTTVSGYALLLGAAGGNGLVASGLMTSAGNLPIYLYMDGDVVVGSTALNSGAVNDGNTVFTVEIVGGNVVLTQFQAVEHGDAPDNFDENTSGLATNALQLEVTAEDFDGDTDSDTVDLGSIITFGDDGPSVEVSVAQMPTGGDALDAVQLVTQDDGTEGPGFTTDSTTANFSGLFGLNKDGGSDGEASSSLTFDLDLLGAGNGPVDSGLDSHGQTIFLYQVNANTIVGSTSATPVGVGHASVVFQLSTTDAGAVTLTQFQQIDHPIAGDPSPTGGPDFDDHEAILGSDLIELVATGSITDNDGDVDTDTERLDLGGLVRFQDDGPTIDATLDANASVHVDESDPGVDGPGETDDPGLGRVTVALSAIVDVAENPVSADQPTTFGYALVLGPAEGGLVNSGLTTSAGDLPIYLYSQPDGSVVGSTALNSGAVDGGNTVFTVAIVGGNVVLTQFQAIEHPDAGPPGPDHDENTLGLADGALLLQVTGTDFDGDTDSDTVDLGSVITFGDDGPVAFDEAQQTVAENAATVGGTFDFDGGSDGASVTHINGIELTFGGDDWSQWIPVDDGQIRAQADGSYEFDPDGNASGVTSGTFTVTDSDGDTDVGAWSFNITDANAPSAGSSNALLDDDGLVVPADPVLEAGNGDINANEGEVATVNPSEAVFHGDLNASFGGDGAGSINFAAMAAPGVFRMVGTERVHFTWDAASLTLTAVVSATNGGDPQARAGTELFEVVLDPSFNGNYTLTLLDNVLHATGGDEASAPPVSLTFNIIDADNSPAGGVQGTLVVTFNDDMPEAEVDGTVNVPTLTLDETRPAGEDEGGPNVTTGLASVQVGFANNFQAADYGADGPGTISYALVLEAEGAGSGMYALDNSDTTVTVGDGYGQGAEILLFSEPNGSITGRTVDGGPIYFTISVNASGQVTFTQNLNVWHSDLGDDDDTSGLSAAAETLQLQQTVTDADGDSDTALIDLSDGVFFIEDDGPEITLATDAQGDNTGLTPTATGDFAFDVGTDSPNGGNDDIFIDPSSVVIEINNVAIDPADITFTDDGEDADFANYSFEFPYNTGSGGTVIATGTLVFDKNAGTYTVTLTSGPIEGFSTLETAKGTAFVGYQLNDDPSDPDVLDNTQPQVAVTTIVDESAPGENDGFYVQFTGFTAGNGSHETINYDLVDPSTGNGVDNSWTEGELFSEGTGANALTQSWVSVSNASNGVGGDTVNGPDALNFSLYSSNPGGTFGGTPTASASDMFLVFDGTDAGDDFIVVLKLFDPDSGEYTTKSIVVEGSDIYFFDAGSEAATVAALAGTPYENVVADIVALGGSNNNDGLVIIESNDYNTGSENWVIVGAQIVNTNSGVSGTGINLDRDVGDDGNSTGTQSFAVADDSAPMKITNIGFLAGSSNDQAMELSFDVTITDADGDSETTSLTATIGDPPAETLAATSFSAQDEQLQKSAANSNTLTLAAAVAAAGMAESAAASPPADGQSFDTESESSASTQEVSMVLADDGGDEGGSSVSGLPETSEAEAPGNSGGHSRAQEHRSDNKVDAGTKQQASDEGSSNQATNDQGPATETAAANAVAPTVGMPSAEALLAAGLTGETAKHTGQVEEILADALGQGGAPTVDGLLAHLSGGLGELAALSNVASPAAGNVPGWDMAMHGGSGFAADVLTKLDAAMLQHHDAVQPAVNG